MISDVVPRQLRHAFATEGRRDPIIQPILWIRTACWTVVGEFELGYPRPASVPANPHRVILNPAQLFRHPKSQITCRPLQVPSPVEGMRSRSKPERRDDAVVKNRCRCNAWLSVILMRSQALQGSPCRTQLMRSRPNTAVLRRQQLPALSMAQNIKTQLSGDCPLSSFMCRLASRFGGRA